MKNDHPESWNIFIEYYPLFKKIEERLAAREWFADGWVFYTGYFNEGIFLQLYKPWWYNHRQRGIHLETWISIDGVRNRSVPVVLHLERETPERETLNRLLAERGSDLIASWPGYHASRTSRMERFILRFPLQPRTLVSRLVEEFSRTQAIGRIIDDALRETAVTG